MGNSESNCLCLWQAAPYMGFDDGIYFQQISHEDDTEESDFELEKERPFYSQLMNTLVSCGFDNEIAKVISEYSFVDPVNLRDIYNDAFCKCCADLDGNMYFLTGDFKTLVQIKCDWPNHNIKSIVDVIGIPLTAVREMSFKKGHIFLTGIGGNKHNRACVMKLNVTNGVVSMYAGSMTKDPRLKDGNLSHATFNDPFGIDVDQENGDMYVTEYYNGKVRVISEGSVHTLGVQVDRPQTVIYDSGMLYMVGNDHFSWIDGYDEEVKVTKAWSVQSLCTFLNDGSIYSTGALRQMVREKVSGNFYIAHDSDQSSKIRIISADCQEVYTLRSVHGIELAFNYLSCMAIGGEHQNILYVLHGGELTAIPLQVPEEAVCIEEDVDSLIYEEEKQIQMVRQKELEFSIQ